MLFRRTSVYFDNCVKHKNTPCGKIVVFSIVNECGLYSTGNTQQQVFF